jgi:hypothetical protein
VSLGGVLYTSYASTMLVGFADGQPSTSLTTPDVTFTKVPAGTVKPPLHIGTVTFTETGNDGNIDPGDLVHLKIPLTNYDTNPLHAGSVSSIFATLSTSTPGVSVTQAGSAYPDLPPVASATNSTDFLLQIASGFVPGTSIELSLNVSTAGGPTALLLTQETGTPVYTTLLSENFDGVAPGSLPAGWTAAHGAGTNTVPWTTSSSFATTLCGTSNKAFHQNANDSNTSDQARWERLFSPIITIPGNAQWVTLDFDVCYDTEDDSILRVLGYDGFFLRITDQTAGRTLRSVLAEAFEDEFTTGALQHYPKHFPRNSDSNYFDDMSAWSGFSNGPQHVHMKFPGMAGSRAQLRFEFAQDQSGICSDVRPGHACGVTVDNIMMRSVVSIQPLSVTIVVTASLSRDSGTNEVVASLTLTNTGTGPASNVQLTSALLGSTATTTPLPNVGTIPAGGSAMATLRFPGTAGSPGAASVLRVAGSYTGGTFASSSRVTLP